MGWMNHPNVEDDEDDDDVDENDIDDGNVVEDDNGDEAILYKINVFGRSVRIKLCLGKL